MKDNGNGEKGGTNGSLNGATTADLKRGYTTSGDSSGNTLHEVSETEYPDSPPGGFAGRPDGWER